MVEVGDHKNLMTFKGHYYALVTLQMGSVEQGNSKRTRTCSQTLNVFFISDGQLEKQEKDFIETYDEDSREIDILPEEVRILIGH